MSILNYDAHQQLENVEAAFSRQAASYDQYEMDHPILQWMRTQVRDHAMSFVRSGDRILDLNAGTGLDSVFFAENECYVHAIDISSGMIAELRKKISSQNLGDRISSQICSITELKTIDFGPFDFVFSNFGGMNCVPDLQIIAKEIPRLLKPHGFFTMVLMPPVCPWELGLVFRGKLKTAIRRLRRHGTLSHVEGIHFMAHYFTPGKVLKAFGPGFRKVKLQGLASLSPPPYMKNFSKRNRWIYDKLADLDRRIGEIPPFNRWADHFILTVQHDTANHE